MGGGGGGARIKPPGKGNTINDINRPAKATNILWKNSQWAAVGPKTQTRHLMGRKTSFGVWLGGGVHKPPGEFFFFFFFFPSEENKVAYLSFLVITVGLQGWDRELSNSTRGRKALQALAELISKRKY